jgi:predicted nucleic acid-binding protein
LRIVVADTGPLQYLVIIGHIDILPRLFESVTIPAAVQTEMLHPGAPQAVRTWAGAPPSWLAVAPGVPDSDATLQKLDAGERAAIMLALAMKAELVLMDDRAGFAAAVAKGLRITGTLGVLDLAARSGLVDLEAAFEQLKATNFRRPPAIFEAMLAAWHKERGT